MLEAEDYLPYSPSLSIFTGDRDKERVRKRFCAEYHSLRKAEASYLWYMQDIGGIRNDLNESEYFQKHCTFSGYRQLHVE